jgi:hypothetical protein
MQRRSFLASTACAMTLAACASKPKVPLKPNELRAIGMLPVKEWIDKGSTAQFNPLSNPVPATMAGAPPPISPSMLGMAIGQSIRASRDAERMALVQAIAPVNFDPGATLLATMQRELDRRGIELVALKSGALAARVRDNVLKELPTDVDAILDVQVYSAGYYPLGKNLGFSPYASVLARVLDTVNPGHTIEEFSYGGDSSPSDGDTRYFQLPAALVQPSLASFAGNAQTIRREFEQLFDRIGVKLVDDLARVRDKLPRLA